MRTKDEIIESLNKLQLVTGRPIDADESAIAESMQKNNSGQSITVKILSVIAGLLACVAFYASLIISGLYNSASGLLITGTFCITVAILICKSLNKIIFDTVSVSSYVIGFALLGLGLYELKVEEDYISVLFIVVALLSLTISGNYILSFVSVLIISGSILTLIVSNREYNLIHVYVSAMAVFLSYLIVNEAAIIVRSKAVSKLYDPLRVGLTFAFLAGLLLIGTTGMLKDYAEHLWVSSVFILGAIIYVLLALITVLEITKVHHKVYVFACVPLLLPTIQWPAIAGSILLMLLSFLVNFKTGFVVAIAAFIYFVCQYYYDLNATLLTKSLILLSSGVLFLLLYFITRKKLLSHE